ncbi:ferritin-like domain-containing protein [Terasakiella pusilla]|uniref:ferritin-like domain-containing protein n=1 Tax=Terasakiella pusilla TaxID=64973 RepID=UPI003AA82696
MKISFSSSTEFAVSSFYDLICIAYAIETEAVTRYEFLENEMKKRGSLDIAKTFQNLMQQEVQHVEDVKVWAEKHHYTLPVAKGFSWKLPAEFNESWQEVVNSTLLTPYKALAIAVQNEERAFAFYTYISAHAQTPDIREAAEKMAHEELEHAMHLRKLRRREFHLMKKHQHHIPHTLPARLEEFEQQVGTMHQHCQDRYQAVVKQLHILNEASSAELLTRLANELSPAARPHETEEPTPDLTHKTARDLLLQAQAPLENFIEFCEFVIEKTPCEDILLRAHSVLEQAISHLSRLAFQQERLD